MSQQQSGPVSPREDEQQAHETQGREPEPAGEDQPTGDETLGDLPGTPPGMDGDDVELRSEIARFLQPSRFPASRDDLVDAATQHQATDRVLGLLQRLPDVEFTNVEEIAKALGIGTEQHRT